MILILFYLQIVTATRHRFLPLLTNNAHYSCSDCKFGPVQLSHKFTIFDEPLNQLYIHADGIVNNKNCTNPLLCDTRISILNYSFRNLSCQIFHNEVTSKFKLVWIDALVRKIKNYSNFTATWAYTIFWAKVGSHFQDCQNKNLYQMILVTDDKSNFVLFNYVNSNYLPATRSTTDIRSKNNRINIKFNINKLYHSSNINVAGIWVHNVDNHNVIAIEGNQKFMDHFFQESMNIYNKAISFMFSDSNINYNANQVYITNFLALITIYLIR